MDTLMSFIIQDIDGRRRSNHVHFAAAVSEAALQAYATAYAPLLNAILGAAIVKAEYTKELTLPGAVVRAPVAQHDARVGGRLSFQNASRYKYGVDVPGMLLTMFSGDELTTGDQAFIDYASAYTAGLGGTQPTNGHSEDLTSLASSEKVVRK